MSGTSFYRADTGLFIDLHYGGSDPAWLEVNTPEGCIALAGRFDHLSQRVDLATGLVVDYQPPAPAADELRDWSWDAEVRRWVAVPTTLALAVQARRRRDELLKACDWVTVRALDLGEPVPASWVAYRQALRDVPEQLGFPGAVDWPVPPA